MIKIYKKSQCRTEDILKREETDVAVTQAVGEILDNVRKNKDAAVCYYTEKFDGVRVTELAVTRDEMKAAADRTEPEFLSVLREAAENIRAFHAKQKRGDFIVTEREGVLLGQRIIPLERVGLYVPGGTASYPSSVLMNCIPAKIAGVSEIVMATPPKKDGRIPDTILAAAYVAGVDTVYKMGGAQAIGAFAYGTQTVKRVDKIVGPGNIFVAEAKKRVLGVVDIDMIAGPSEILVIADKTCDPRIVAADLLSQAEHDRLATAVLITDSESLARDVAEQLELQLPLLPRADIARASIDSNGKIIITDTIAQALEISNLIAPEHLEICTDNPFDFLGAVKNAGSVFLGKNTPEAAGDYFAGPNHTLPTNGTARFSSPLSTDDFVKKTQFIYYTADALRADGGKIAYFAESEGLSAHARSVLYRTDAE